MLLEKYVRTDFKDQDDFEKNFRIDVPDNFNFSFDCIDELARTKPDRTAMVWCDDEGAEARYTFADLADETDAAARYFRSLGIGKGDTVMLMLRRRPQFWFTILALIKLGAIAIPATHQLTTKDIVYRNNAANIKMIISTDEEAELKEIENSKDESPSLKHIVKLGNEKRQGWRNYEEEVAEFFKGREIERVTRNEDDMLLYFTSGTTGPPKMVIHNHIYPLGHIVTARFWQNLGPESLHLTLADTGWGKAVWGKLFGQWLCEAAVFIYDHKRFGVKKLLEVISKHKITSFCAPPTVYRYLIRAKLEDYDLSSIKWAVTAGEPLNPEVCRDFEAKTGLEIREGYGQTETTPIILTSLYMDPHFGYLGKPNPTYDVDLLDSDEKPVSDGTPGEICIRSKPGQTPGLFSGYYKDPTLTARTWTNDIYHTGDLAVRDKDGYYEFVGRADDVIKVSSYRIGPFEVESVLIEHPAVVECAVTGVPDPIRGQAVKASIILAEEYTASDKLSRELQHFVKENTAYYKAPRFIEFVDELPKTISGKIRRVEIREKSSENSGS